jgi:hypothetical protein
MPASLKPQSRQIFPCSLLSAHRSLSHLIAHHSLLFLVAHCSLLIAHCFSSPGRLPIRPYLLKQLIVWIRYQSHQVSLALYPLHPAFCSLLTSVFLLSTHCSSLVARCFFCSLLFFVLRVRFSSSHLPVSVRLTIDFHSTSKRYKSS